MKKKKYKHIRFEERFTIEKLLKAKLPIRRIAEFLDRSPNTISYEVRKNVVNGKYSAKKANHKAYVKRWRSKRMCMKVAMDGFLTRFVEKKLREKWSPKQISGYLDFEYGITCSDKAIYKFTNKRGLDYLLFWSWNNKRGGPKKGGWNTTQDGRKRIDSRPPVVGSGHFELDFVVSSQSTSVLLVATDITTKNTLIERLPNRKHTTVSRALSNMFRGHTVKSITTDNDIAFNHWKEIEEQLHTSIYFTDPYCSWQKGLVENTNRWIRCFVPKKRDIASVTEEEIQDMLSFLNDRPREIIEFRTPREYYLELTSVLLEG